MYLANPLYDTAFKYLMEDLEIAADLIGAIIGAKIVELEFKPRVITGQIKAYGGVAVLRLDFKANIITRDGEQKTVLIELQKGKKPVDIMRFRRYLGETYRKPEIISDGEGETKRVVYPIVSIYILGYPLPNVLTPVLMVNRVYHDLANQTILDIKDPFVEMLSHDSYVIQVGRLREPYQSELEQVLKVFDQRFQMPETPQLLDMPKKEVLGNILRERIARRLREAATDEETLQQLEVEEEVQETLDDYARQLQEMASKAEEMTNKAEEMESKAEEMESKAEEMTSKAEEMESRAEEMTSKAEEMESMADELAEENKGLLSENELLKKQLEEMKRRLGDK